MDVVGCDVHMYTRACVCRMYDCLLLVDACISDSLCCLSVCGCMYIYMRLRVCVQGRI